MDDQSPQIQDGRPPLERDLQAFLAENLRELGEELVLVGTEYAVPFGRIDLLAKDPVGALVAIELKLGTAGRDAVGQLQSYMGALQDSKPNLFVRGLLVASGLDAGAEAALRVARDIRFIAYRLAFRFAPGVSSPSTHEEWERNRRTGPASAVKKVWVPPRLRQ